MTTPSPMTKAEFVAVLEDIKAHVEAEDSFEGSLMYTFPWREEFGDPETDSDEVQFRVQAAYRTGNSMGQGGMRIVGKV